MRPIRVQKCLAPIAEMPWWPHFEGSEELCLRDRQGVCTNTHTLCWGLLMGTGCICGGASGADQLGCRAKGAPFCSSLKWKPAELINSVDIPCGRRCNTEVTKTWRGTSDEATPCSSGRLNPRARVGYLDSVFPCSRGRLRPHLLGEAINEEGILILFC